MKVRYGNSWRGLLCFLLLYAVCLLLLLPKLSLWLDEVIDLRQIRDDDLSGLLAHVPTNAGGVPLSYLVRAVFVHVLGYSRFSGRLPSALFSLGACAGVFILGRRLQLRYPLLGVLIFCSLPLQLRYALESRPYSQALALTIWATVVFAHLSETPTGRKALLYGCIALASLYTQPYTIFVFLAHVFWLCCFETRRNRRQILLFTGMPVTLAVWGFLPWHLWAVHLWKQSAAAQQRYEIGWATVPVILRELVGGGYPATILILSLIFVSFALGLHNHKERSFWGLFIIAPIVSAALADAAFGYFFAIRQTIFVLTPLSLLTALGIEKLAQHRRVWAWGSCLLLVAILLIGDVRFFRKPREDWEAAAHILQKLAAQGDCVLFVPASSIDLYRFFDPHLSSYTCPGDVYRFHAVALAVNPYESREEPATVKKLSEAGWVKSKEWNYEGPKVELYERACALRMQPPAPGLQHRIGAGTKPAPPISENKKIKQVTVKMKQHSDNPERRISTAMESLCGVRSLGGEAAHHPC